MEIQRAQPSTLWSFFVRDSFSFSHISSLVSASTKGIKASVYFYKRKGILSAISLYLPFFYYFSFGLERSYVNNRVRRSILEVDIFRTTGTRPIYKSQIKAPGGLQWPNELISGLAERAQFITKGNSFDKIQKNDRVDHCFDTMVPRSLAN